MLKSTNIRIKVDDKFLIHFSEVRQNAITVNTTVPNRVLNTNSTYK